MSSSAEGGTDGSAYRSEFRNLFGGDSNVEEEEAGGGRENRNKDGLDVVRSVQPSSLLSEAPMQMVEGEATNGPENNITPSILLEQLAYVDNFMPSLEQDFANLDSWILQDTGAGGGGESAGMMASGQGVSEGGGGIGFDERLAAELSAFADDSFIFPDEDKRTAQGANTSGGMPGGFDSGSGDANGGANGDAVPNANNNSENASNDNDERQQQQRANGRRSAHFLTQRRNTFLTSQYDYSKSRFSSKSREKREAQDQQQQQQQQEEDGNEFFNISVGGSPLQDHGGFTNVDIVSGSGSVRGASNNNDNNNNNNDNRSPRLTQHSPNIPSPLNNVLATTTSSQPYSVSASPIITDQQDTTQSRPQIHVPDYSTLPTSTLVALLPRISVPRGAQKTLANSGFSQEQIDAVAVIIAYNEQEKLKRQHNQGSASGDIRSSNNNVNDQDASRGAEFLLGILSQGSKPQPQPQPQQQRREQQQGFVESLLQLDHPHSSTHDQGEDLERSISHDEGQQRIKRENSVAGLLGSEEEEEEETDVLTTSVRPLKRSRSTEETLSFINTNGSTKRRNGSSGAILSSLPTAAAATGSTSAAHVQKTHQRRKVKEKELENSVTELSELAVSLQQKIHTLEMENKLLKNLVRSSGELEGIEKAENIKRQIIDKINDSSGGGE